MTEVQKKEAHPIVAEFEAKQPQLEALIGKANLAVFKAATLSTLRHDSKLLRCSANSFVAAAFQAAQIGLTPGQLGHVYVVPYGKNATLIVGYKGLMELAMRHPMVKQVEAKIVFNCEADTFEFDQETNRVTHKWKPGVRSAETFYCAYSRVWLHDTERPLVLVFDKDQVEERRKRSKAKDSNFWTKDWLAMARKTVVRAHYNGGEVPVSPQLKQALEHEERIEKAAEILSVEDVDDRSQIVQAEELEVKIEPQEEQDMFGLGDPE